LDGRIFGEQEFADSQVHGPVLLEHGFLLVDELTAAVIYF